MDIPDAVTISEAARRAGRHRSTIHRWLQEARLATLPDGKVCFADVERCSAAQTTGRPPGSANTPPSSRAPRKAQRAPVPRRKGKRRTMCDDIDAIEACLEAFRAAAPCLDKVRFVSRGLQTRSDLCFADWIGIMRLIVSIGKLPTQSAMEVIHRYFKGSPAPRFLHEFTAMIQHPAMAGLLAESPSGAWAQKEVPDPDTPGLTWSGMFPVDEPKR